MNERINYLKTYILDKRHHSQRRAPSSIGLDKLNTIYAQQGLSPVERATACFAATLNSRLYFRVKRSFLPVPLRKYRIYTPLKNGTK